MLHLVGHQLQLYCVKGTSREKVNSTRSHDHILLKSNTWQRNKHLH